MQWHVHSVHGTGVGLAGNLTQFPSRRMSYPAGRLDVYKWGVDEQLSGLE